MIRLDMAALAGLAVDRVPNIVYLEEMFGPLRGNTLNGTSVDYGDIHNLLHTKPSYVRMCA